MLPAHKILRILWQKTNCASCVFLIGSSRLTIGAQLKTPSSAGVFYHSCKFRPKDPPKKRRDESALPTNTSCFGVLTLVFLRNFHFFPDFSFF